MKRIKTTFLVIALIATAGMVSMAFAHGGWDGDDYGGHMGYGGHMMGPGMMGYGYGYGMGPGMMGYGPGYGRWGRGDDAANLSREDNIKLQQVRDKFFDETRALRDEIRDKQFALNNALNSDNPDAAKVTGLQKEISQLQSQYDQKALAYRLEVRKLLPERADRDGYGYGYGPGFSGCRW